MTPIKANFPGTCKRCRHAIIVGERILWQRGYGSTHLTQARCDEAVKAAALKVVAAAPAEESAPGIDASAIVTLLTGAKDRGLKFPKARFAGPAPEGGEILLYIAGPKANVPGAVNVKWRGEWVGRVNPNGDVVGGRLIRNSALLNTIRRIAESPADLAKEYGAITGQCSFCSRGLKDEGSVEVGYGPVCADKFGLPWKRGGSAVVKALPVAA